MAAPWPPSALRASATLPALFAPVGLRGTHPGLRQGRRWHLVSRCPPTSPSGFRKRCTEEAAAATRQRQRGHCLLTHPPQDTKKNTTKPNLHSAETETHRFQTARSHDDQRSPRAGAQPACSQPEGGSGLPGRFCRMSQPVGGSPLLPGLKQISATLTKSHRHHRRDEEEEESQQQLGKLCPCCARTEPPAAPAAPGDG